MIIVVASKAPKSGKTFTALNLAAALADMGINTLLIDGDPNDRLAEINDLSESGVIFGKKSVMVMRTLPGGDLKILSGFGRTLNQEDAREQNVETVKKLRGEFEIIIVDTSSSDEHSLQICMGLGDLVITPVQYDRACVAKIPAILNLCLDTRHHVPGLQFGGFLPCMIDGQKKGTEEAQAAELTLRNLSQEFHGLFLCDPITTDGVVLNAARTLTPIKMVDDTSLALQQFRVAATRVHALVHDGNVIEDAPLSPFDSALEGISAVSIAVAAPETKKRTGLGALFDWITSFLKK